MTLPNADKDLLMLAPSLSRSPVAPVLSARSEPGVTIMGDGDGENQGRWRENQGVGGGGRRRIDYQYGENRRGHEPQENFDCSICSNMCMCWELGEEWTMENGRAV